MVISQENGGKIRIMGVVLDLLFDSLSGANDLGRIDQLWWYAGKSKVAITILILNESSILSKKRSYQYPSLFSEL